MCLTVHFTQSCESPFIDSTDVDSIAAFFFTMDLIHTSHWSYLGKYLFHCFVPKSHSFLGSSLFPFLCILHSCCPISCQTAKTFKAKMALSYHSKQCLTLSVSPTLTKPKTPSEKMMITVQKMNAYNYLGLTCRFSSKHRVVRAWRSDFPSSFLFF